MKVFIAGGTGRVAGALILDLLKKDNEVYASSRHPEKIEKLDHLDPVFFDLHWEVEQMKEVIQGMDAVYFVAGSRGKDLLQTDAFGAVKLMKACEECGIKRYIQLSSIFSLEPKKWKEEPSLASIIDYDIAKFFADEYLIHSTDLDYTIVQPSVLKEEVGTGKIEINPDHDGSNSIEDVAQVLCDILTLKNTEKKVIKMRSGTVPIQKALEQIH